MYLITFDGELGLKTKYAIFAWCVGSPALVGAGQIRLCLLSLVPTPCVRFLTLAVKLKPRFLDTTVVGITCAV